MRQKTIRYAAAGTVAVVLVLVLFVMLNWISARRFHQFDWTSSKLYTLSEKTLNILGGLEEDVEVVVFMTRSSEPELFEKIELLLNQYVAASERIKIEYIDPDRQPLRTKQLAERFGVSMANTVVFSIGDRSKYVTSADMVEYDYQGAQYGSPPTVRAFKGEEAFTSAILSIAETSVPKVYFVTGHGEASLGAGGAAGGRGVAVLAEALRRENIEAEDTTLLTGEVPVDADVLAIIGPTRPYTEAEVESLRGFLAEGGRLLVCLDPLIESDGTMRSTRLEGFLSELGVEVGDDLVVDDSRRLPFYDLSAVYLTDFLDHPVTRGLEGIAVLFMVTRSLTIDPQGDATSLVQTSDGGWGESNLNQLLVGEPIEQDDADVPGPVTVAAAIEGERSAAEAADDEEGEDVTTWRVVACGDSDFLSDFEISNAGNLALGLNALNWLAAREESIGVPPRVVEQFNLFLGRDQVRWILLITLVALPVAAIVGGVFAWRMRRH